MIIKLLCIGKIKEPYLSESINEYIKRMRRYGNVDYREIKAEKRSKHLSDQEVKQREYERLCQALTPQDYLIALDESGVQYSSEEFAAFIARCQTHGTTKTLTFVTGGATGLSELLLKDADTILSLSTMTFPHQLCRLILIEQLYRAYTIIAGEAYHK